MSNSDKYADYVEHPRYGRSPRYTVLNPDLAKVEGLPVTDESHEIPSTEIGTFKSCYRDIQRLCRDCGRPFIFCAEEQIYWYETLGFSVGAVCVMCVDCRKRQQRLARLLRRYQGLSRSTGRTDRESLELSACCLTLIEQGAFTHKKIARVRELLNSLQPVADPEIDKQSRLLRERIRLLES